MEDKITLSDAWDKAKPKERAEFVAGLCKFHHALVCPVIIEQGKCKASWLKQYLFNKNEQNKK